MATLFVFLLSVWEVMPILASGGGGGWGRVDAVSTGTKKLCLLSLTTFSMIYSKKVRDISARI